MITGISLPVGGGVLAFSSPVGGGFSTRMARMVKTDEPLFAAYHRFASGGTMVITTSRRLSANSRRRVRH
ncbi:hypothetical protein [Mesorhizobium sp. NFR06]|uniref:hypothetical protein n=1 Tax=Mesorhizobium sp. NFR06 TaxID=1566290 RepID=UPI00122D540F|nr:hypothetical protein [Mesorhizobium sp. NFR06]